jgi:DNA repair exonuclease SbcCD ATPase subunit
VVTPEVVRLETQIRELNKQAAVSEGEANPYQDQAQTLRRKISVLTTDLEALDKDVVSAERELERTRFWVKGFKDVRLYLLEELLQELELATNALLPESGLRDWAVRYAVEKETKKGTTVQGLNVTVLSPHNKSPVRWEVWSGGEGHRLRIVGALALAEVLLAHAGVQTNLEVLDEPTQHISQEGIQDLCEFLAVRAKQFEKDVFFIDQMAVESAHFSEIITVVKTATGSYLE